MDVAKKTSCYLKLVKSLNNNKNVFFQRVNDKNSQAIKNKKNKRD